MLKSLIGIQQHSWKKKQIKDAGVCVHLEWGPDDDSSLTRQIIKFSDSELDCRKGTGGKKWVD